MKFYVEYDLRRLHAPGQEGQKPNCNSVVVCNRKEYGKKNTFRRKNTHKVELEVINMSSHLTNGVVEKFYNVLEFIAAVGMRIAPEVEARTRADAVNPLYCRDGAAGRAGGKRSHVSVCVW